METNVSKSQVVEIRSQFQNYIKSSNPEWSTNRIDKTCSDAFFALSNDVGFDFWGSFINESTLANAREMIVNYIFNSTESADVDEQADAYLAAMRQFKSFMEQQGGVEKIIGKEIALLADYRTIYQVAKQVHEGIRDIDEASLELHERVSAYSIVSHKMAIMSFMAMMQGKKFTRRVNIEMLSCFLEGIGKDYSKETLNGALQSVIQNMQYYYQKTENRSNGMREACQAVADEYQLPVRFDESIFDGIQVEKMNMLPPNHNEISLGWFVGAYDSDAGDQTDNFINNGVWVNGYDDKYLNVVSQIRKGDRIAIKSTYTQKKNLPFSANGATSSVMAIKAIGIVTNNRGDGRTVDVHWEKLAEPKKWYFFTGRSTIWKVEARSDDWMYQALLDFTFKNAAQDYDRFLAHPYWANIFAGAVEEGNVEDDAVIAESTQEIKMELYGKREFLDEVFISEGQYDTICELLLRKKNIILQGAPGVGKTFAAKRLAYSILGMQDDERVEIVQFHQSFSYEDFIMGYRPDVGGFSLKNGSFYKFCKYAEEKPDKQFFFIIDEINRGNMSKIFGELLMLIESDKRGQTINLLYTGKPFAVPKNLYIIGMMNTADRSLAVIDYALRRRFSFVELEPAFSVPGFQAHLQKHGVSDALILRIITNLIKLNQQITTDSSLGRGFCIGHSYFCERPQHESLWYENIIRYEIAPMLEEYWFDDPAKAASAIQELLA